jgi:hypothetical protein
LGMPFSLTTRIYEHPYTLFRRIRVGLIAFDLFKFQISRFNEPRIFALPFSPHACAVPHCALGKEAITSYFKRLRFDTTGPSGAKTHDLPFAKREHYH